VPANALAILEDIPRDLVPAALARLAARALEPVAPEPTDELLTADEVARIVKADKRWVQRHARELGGVKLSRRKLRFSRRRVLRYVEARR